MNQPQQKKKSQTIETEELINIKNTPICVHLIHYFFHSNNELSIFIFLEKNKTVVNLNSIQ